MLFCWILLIRSRLVLPKVMFQYSATNIEEAFVEAYCDETLTKISKAFIKLLDERLKKVFKL